ncbi:hypothetical protein ElyMa_004542700 [Elysia marginata]|uniref:Uncharacterized protein n=1 Tax=Elysia marginata TaxID=1093978 RepID=A0AAV4HRI7_9GAST|nr:hypothetical protein ElyMa_004542700 [Elysia marginata]
MEAGSRAFQRVLIGHSSAFKQRAQPEVKNGASKNKTETRRKLPTVVPNKMAGNRHNGEKLHCMCGRGRLDVMKGHRHKSENQRLPQVMIGFTTQVVID